MKTAISIADDLFEAVEAISKTEQISRSQVFTHAVREYLDRRSNKALLDQLNQAYAIPDTSEEQELKARSKQYSQLRGTVDDEW